MLHHTRNNSKDSQGQNVDACKVSAVSEDFLRAENTQVND